MSYLMSDLGYWLLHLDWFKVNRIVIVSLISLIIILRVFIFVGRWGKSNADNLQINRASIGLTTGYASSSINYFEFNRKKSADRESRRDLKQKSIIIFTPYLVGPKKLTFFASGFVQNGYRVFLFSARSLLSELYDSCAGDMDCITANISNIISSLDADVIISFDVFSPSLVNFGDNDELQYFFIRPICSKKALRLTDSVIFSRTWLLKFFIRIFGGGKYVARSLDGGSEEKHQFPEVYYLIPKDCFSDPKSSLKFKFSAGGVDFRQQETILFAKILSRIRELNEF